MFGYVRPLQGKMNSGELEAYQAAYCGLCHTLGRRYGLFARFLLNYDFTLLAMLLSPVSDKPALEHRRCIRCPLKGKTVCSANSGLDAAADESVILTWWKLRDSIEDGGAWERAKARAMCLFLKSSYRRSAAARPEFDRETRDCLAQLHALEKENCPSLDRTADAFARILRAAAPPTGDTARDRAMGQLLYHVGRWIYLVDAWDDLAEDCRSGSYNPIHARFQGEEEGQQEYLRSTLDRSLDLALSAFELLDLGGWRDVVENILSMGLPTVEELVLRGEWKEARRGKTRRGRTDRQTARQPDAGDEEIHP